MMSANEMGCGKEETGKEDREKETVPGVNMHNEKTHVEGKDPPFSAPVNNQDQIVGENVDLKTENNDVKSLGLPTDNRGSVDNQTFDDAKFNANVDQLHGNTKFVELESVDNNDKGHKSSAASQDVVDLTAAKTGNNDSVDVNAKELCGHKNDRNLVVEPAAAKTDNDASVDVNVNKLSGSENDGSLVQPLNQLEYVATGGKSSEIKAENDERGEKLNDASAVDVSDSRLSGSKNYGSHIHSMKQLEGAAADERSPEIKAENAMEEKLDDASLVEISANRLCGSKDDGSHAHPLNQLEHAEADERSSEMKAENDEKGEKLADASIVDLNVNNHSDTKNDGSHAHMLNQLERATVDEGSSEIKAEDDEKGEELNGVNDMELSLGSDFKESKPEEDVECEVGMKSSNLSFLYEPPVAEGDESGTEEEQVAFVKEVENFYKERSLEFKHPKFYKEDLNLLKYVSAAYFLSSLKMLFMRDLLIVWLFCFFFPFG